MLEAMSVAVDSLQAEQLEAERMEQFNASLAGHILTQYQLNKDARLNSGVETEMLNSLRAYNGHYNPSDLQLIRKDGGSEIFMNLTSTKCRACASWIKDIILPSNGRAWEVNPSVVEDIDPELMKQIEEVLQEEFSNYEQSEEQSEGPGAQEGVPPPTPAPGSPPVPPPKKQGGATALASKLREMNQARRDIQDTIREEIRFIAKAEMKEMERMIEDQLNAGEWERCLSDFIDNFVVYPTAFMKGPIITKKIKLSYQGGQIVENEDYVFMNRVVNPLDMYPSPEATCIYDGNLCEHIRLSRKDLVVMKGLPTTAGYKDSAIDDVLTRWSAPEFVSWWDSNIEDEKATEEKRGTSTDSNRNIIHGIHFHGSASVRSLRDWGYPEDELLGLEDTDEVEIEAILADNTVVKVLVSDDPLKRRPYYAASFQNRPGSFWGRSLPDLMSDIQRMCNGTARALANNMGMSSGPQVEIYVDRLADNGSIEDIYPMKIWQLSSDPTGAGGRAIQFTMVPSNAAELLSVYKEFELRADDATGIPRYAYGNERTGGAAQTASGLSMLLESASKGIKDAIRHIDHGVIIPRVEYQFYWNIKMYPELGYTGDIEVIGKGSAALTMKAAEQGKRMEFLQALAGNPQIMGVVGSEGLAEVFRTMLKDINIPEVVIPSRLELKKKEREAQEQAAQAQQMMLQVQQQKNQVGLQATKEQINGQIQMHLESMRRKDRELDLKEKEKLAESIDRGRELETRERVSAGRNTVDAARARAEQDQADLMQRRELAFELSDLENENPTDRMTK